MFSLNTLLILILCFSNILCNSCCNGKQCGYHSCPHSLKNHTNVHLVPHSHDDAGWLKTFNQYYYGTKNNIQHAGVQYILESVINELVKDPKRRFIWVETSFLIKWYDQQLPDKQRMVKLLIENGQLEIAGGGWTQNDEATVNYQSIIDQFAYGIKKLTQTFGSCARPRVGWQIDSFGHSRAQASIFAEMAFDGEFFARVDWLEKMARFQNLTAEMIWQTSQNPDENSYLFTGLLYNHYSSPPGFCFDILCSDDPIADGKDEENNVENKIDTFINYIRTLSKVYRSNDLLVPMGDDFNYENANVNYNNMDKLIKYVNERVNSTKINIFYSTPSCYLKAINADVLSWPKKTEDFFPYSSDWHSYWTGYYSSRSTVKRFERIGNHVLQVSKQITAFADLSQKSDNLDKLREAMGVMQHHDAITGTEKQHVTNDYNRKLYDGMQIAQNQSKLGLQKLTNWTEFGEFESCLELNISVCNIPSNTSAFTVTIFNPLAHTSTQYVRIPVTGPNFLVRDFEGNVIPSQVVPVPYSIVNLPFRSNKTNFEIVFRARVNKLASYHVTTTDLRTSPLSKRSVTIYKKIDSSNERNAKSKMLDQDGVLRINSNIDTKWEDYEVKKLLPQRKQHSWLKFVNNVKKYRYFTNNLISAPIQQHSVSEEADMQPQQQQQQPQQQQQQTQQQQQKPQQQQQQPRQQQPQPQQQQQKPQQQQQKPQQQQQQLQQQQQQPQQQQQKPQQQQPRQQQPQPQQQQPQQQQQQKNVYPFNWNDIKKNITNVVESKVVQSIIDQKVIEDIQPKYEEKSTNQQHNNQHEMVTQTEKTIKSEKPKRKFQKKAADKGHHTWSHNDKSVNNKETNNDPTENSEKPRFSRSFRKSSVKSRKSSKRSKSKRELYSITEFDQDQSQIENLSEYLSENRNADEHHTIIDIEPIVVASDETFDEIEFIAQSAGELGENDAITVVKNLHVNLTFSNSGQLIMVEMHGIHENIKQEFCYYKSAAGNNQEFKNRSSGAYIFRPNGQAVCLIRPENVVYIKGPIVNEIHQIWNSWISQVIRTYNDISRVEFEWLIGPIPIDDGIGKEVITRINTNINNGPVFYTDSNGREMMKRVRNKREYFEPNMTEWISGNYYPITSRIAIQDDAERAPENVGIRRVAVLTDRSHGGGSIYDGSIELMLHRRLLNDDAFGVGEALNETEHGDGIVARGIYNLILGSMKQKITVVERFTQLELFLPFWKFFSSYQDINNTDIQYKPDFNHLPLCVNVLTYERWSQSEILIRFENILDSNENSEIEFDIGSIIHDVGGSEIIEMTLDGSLPTSEVVRMQFIFDDIQPEKVGYKMAKNMTRISKREVAKDEILITLNPMQIRTFIIKTN